MSDLLTVTGLSVHYGGIQAVRDVSFSVKAGEQTTLIGANGAGKSSTVRAITGLEPFSGEIIFNGQPVRRRKAESLLREGLVDEFLIYLAPCLIGHDAAGLFNLPALTSLDGKRRLQIRDLRQVGADIRVLARSA